MADINAIAKQFTEFYYSNIDGGKPENLASLYRGQSMLTYETHQCQGVEKIMEKLTSQTWKVRRQISTLDVQPSSTTVASLLINVTGILMLEGEDKTFNFSHVFQILPDPPAGNYYVFNEIFRLNLG